MYKNITLGEYIKVIRRRKKLTLIKVSEISGVSVPTISRIEADKAAMFSNVCAIARVLDIPINQLAEMANKKESI